MKTNIMSLKRKSSANSAQFNSWSEMPAMALAIIAYYKAII